ncbi:cation diffusion facilitator family transporter [Facklamia hominis]|uniref:cation diffusion facilitator family transporter n=1 Tax=Facklamia hominis TaxID=178214 RepID=UPI000C7CB199|nr:cation diffusion facilitator family transporter [Facklamia hominis]PKY93918.1 cation transporter [Facklamia hominis]WPJ90843.1 cation diffusion facilitator family transporter [Facklamia hominis]
MKTSFKIATQGAMISIFVYLFLAISKLVVANIFQAGSLKADGLNNLTDIFSSAFVLLGIYFASRPADLEHRFGHEKYELLASFVVSLMMFSIGVQVCWEALSRIFHPLESRNSIIVYLTTFASITVLYLTQFIIGRMAKSSKSIALKATSQDMKNDFYVSLATLFGALMVNLKLALFDVLVSLLVGLSILKSAYDLFMESSFSLSDGFDPELLKEYKRAVCNHPQVIQVKSIRGRQSSHSIYLDIVILLDPDLSVLKSHQITEEIEEILTLKYQIDDIDIHVEPYIP